MGTIMSDQNCEFKMSSYSPQSDAATPLAIESAGNGVAAQVLGREIHYS